MTKEERFWTWFKENEHRYFFLNQVDDDTEKERLLDELLEQLHEYSNDLYFEVGGQPDEKQELIISAEGNVKYFDLVEALVGQAPALEYWNVIAFKPVMEDFTVTYEGVSLHPKTMRFIPLVNKASHKLGLRIYLNEDDFSKESGRGYRVELVLDNLLGEKSHALDIGYIEIKKLTPQVETKELIEMVKLPRYLSWRKQKRSM